MNTFSYTYLTIKEKIIYHITSRKFALIDYTLRPTTSQTHHVVALTLSSLKQVLLASLF